MTVEFHAKRTFELTPSCSSSFPWFLFLFVFRSVVCIVLPKVTKGDGGLFQQGYLLVSIGVFHAHNRQMQKSLSLYLHPLEVVASLP